MSHVPRVKDDDGDDDDDDIGLRQGKKDVEKTHKTIIKCVVEKTNTNRESQMTLQHMTYIHNQV